MSLSSTWYRCLLLVLLSAGESGAEAPVIAAREGMALEFRGELLVSELGCVACHDDAREWKRAPRLEGLASRIQRSYFINFVLNPAKIKPGTTMPNVLTSLPEEERLGAAAALADYLWGEDGELELEPIEVEAVEAGKTLYHEVGCVACHNPEGESLKGSSPLVSLDKKYSVASLTALLEDPLQNRPSGRMPDMRLNHWEARNLANFLLREQKGVAQGKGLEKAGNRGAAGKVYFQELGCAQCHEPETVRGDFGKAFAGLDLGKGCTTASYPLSTEQRKELAAVKAEKVPAKMSEEAQVHFRMAQLNCFACHSRDELGGVTDERDAFFTTTNLNLGEQARIPPSLTGVGAKLKPAALRRILVSDGSVRPYMNTRMPRFGSENVEELVAWLGAVDETEPREIEHLEDRARSHEGGARFGGREESGVQLLPYFLWGEIDDVKCAGPNDDVGAIAGGLVSSLFAQSTEVSCLDNHAGLLAQREVGEAGDFGGGCGPAD